MAPSPEEFEKLGSFYLGRRYDLQGAALCDELVMYDSKDLTTHALCVGMTGSGKTGLCLALLEEAAIDGIPAIAIDPKGDLANLLLTFPELRPTDFQPWLEQGEATRKGVTLEQLAESKAKSWREGLASWGQDPSRIAKFRDAVDISVYTPGSSAGLPLTVLKGFDAPPEAMREDHDAMREKITSATSSLLSMLGVDADPLTSREHILIGSILDHAWRDGKNVALGDLIGKIQSPPFKSIGVVSLESFMSTADRAKLAMQLNNLLASPAFTTWLQGEPLNIQNLLYTKDGKPRVSIISIAHLSDRERMFFVTILIGELLSWVRGQSGTSSLRALFYMDEVYGYFPPVANPPSKGPMLTLLKQARAFGLGITLATQNPVDLDYKGLSNIGTWLLGRLQTDRDKQRVLDGLEGAAVQGGQPFDRRKMEETLAALGNRVFLMNNVHEDGPVVFQSRWALSYLAGPLAREQISRLMSPRKQAALASLDGGESPASGKPMKTPTQARSSFKPSRPVIPAGVKERFAAAALQAADGEKLVYRPAVLGEGQVHYVKAAANIDSWEDVRLLVDCSMGVDDTFWDSAEPARELDLCDSAEEGIEFTELASELCGAANYKVWAKSLKDHLYRSCPLELHYSPALDAYAPSGSTEGEARIHLGQAAREARDRETQKIREKYEKLDDAMTKKLQSAKEKLDREQAQYDQAKWSSVMEVGASILGGLLGNKRSRISAGRTVTTAKNVGRATSKRSEVQAAADALAELEAEVHDLNDQAKQEISALTQKYDPANLALKTETIAGRKSDLKVNELQLVWLPFHVDRHGAVRFAG